MAEPTLDLDQARRLLDALYQDGDSFYLLAYSDKPTGIYESLARTLVDAARVLTAGASEVTVREVELWQHHMGAAWGRPASEMKTALLDWHEALVAEGIKPKDESGGMESFVFGLPGRRPRSS